MDQYIGEIKIFSFSGIPQGWMPCNGQLLNINTNQALFSLINNYFGGDGKTTFALPDLRGRIIASTGVAASGNNYALGVKGGSDTVTLTTNQIPVHNHFLQAQAATALSKQKAPLAPPKVIAQPTIPNVPGTIVNAFSNSPGTQTNLNPASLDTNGSNIPHENRVPIIALNICIATTGLYPTRP